MTFEDMMLVTVIISLARKAISMTRYRLLKTLK